jgi:hypothetical protein
MDADFPKEQAAAAIEARQQHLLGKRERIVQTIASLNEEIKQIERGIADCEAAARVFGVELAPVSSVLGKASVSGAGWVRAHGVVGTPTVRTTPSVRDLVTEQLQRAHPEPLRAAALRDWLLEHQKMDVHEKTVGMTLYRLAQKGLARRERHNWFWVPETERDNRPEGQSQSGGHPDLESLIG